MEYFWLLTLGNGEWPKVNGLSVNWKAKVSFCWVLTNSFAFLRYCWWQCVRSMRKVVFASVNDDAHEGHC